MYICSARYCSLTPGIGRRCKNETMSASSYVHSYLKTLQPELKGVVIRA